MIMLLLDSGAGRAEPVGLRVDDLDFEYDVAPRDRQGTEGAGLPFGRKRQSLWTATSGPGLAHNANALV